MLPINNSDTAWLIVADYNQENDKFYEDLIEDVIDCNVNDWDFEYLFNASNGGSISGLVGGVMSIRNGISNSVGANRCSCIGGVHGGSNFNNNIYPSVGQLVGGHNASYTIRKRNPLDDNDE